MARSPELKVLAFNCSLKSASGKEQSSTEVLLAQLMEALEESVKGAKATRRSRRKPRSRARKSA